MHVYTAIVIGRGLTGSAAARHLSREIEGVALIGPPEPSERKGHQGVFGSHYDESRIVRTLDCDPHWGLLAARSIARFESLQAESGIKFYHQAGHLAVAEDSSDVENYVNRVDCVSAELRVTHEVLNGRDLRDRFPFLHVPENSTGRFQAEISGTISPRRLVRAQTEMAERQGTAIIPEIAACVRTDGAGVRVDTRAGGVYHADRVLVAAGAFCNHPSLLRTPLHLKFMGRTVLFMEPDDAGLKALRKMPSIIDRSGPPGTGSYILPPCRYPDGKFYLKIGTSLDVEDVLETTAEVADWYRSDGNPVFADLLRGIVLERFPDIHFVSEKTETCVNYYSARTLPYVGCAPEEDNITVIAGGNGGTAKSSDEYGFIAANLVRQGRWDYDLPEELFVPLARSGWNNRDL